MASQTFEWQPAKLLQDQDSTSDFALLVLNQPLKNGANLRKLWKNGSCLRQRASRESLLMRS